MVLILSPLPRLRLDSQFVAGIAQRLELTTCGASDTACGYESKCIALIGNEIEPESKNASTQANRRQFHAAAWLPKRRVRCRHHNGDSVAISQRYRGRSVRNREVEMRMFVFRIVFNRCCNLPSRSRCGNRVHPQRNLWLK